MHVNRSASKVPALRYENAFCFQRSEIWQLSFLPDRLMGLNTPPAPAFLDLKMVISVPSPSSEGSPTSAVSNSHFKARATTNPAQQSWCHHKEGGKKVKSELKKREEISTLQGSV